MLSPGLLAVKRGLVSKTTQEVFGAAVSRASVPDPETLIDTSPSSQVSGNPAFTTTVVAAAKGTVGVAPIAKFTDAVVAGQGDVAAVKIV